MGRRTVPRGRPVEGPLGVNLSFEERGNGVLNLNTTDYHNPAVLSPEAQIKLAVWLTAHATKHLSDKAADDEK